MAERKTTFRDIVLIVLGTAIVSAAVQYVYLPASLDTGGVSGIAVILEALGTLFDISND